ncbi:MAG: Mini-ribonuclease 3 [Clostridiales bacterium GWB2_37_7]|nr:MAG: Mini-ribonuclease 3 [Clostridiales bacterium GWB2_37_7]
MKQTRELLIENKKLSATDIRMFNPLVLAYIGDSVYDTFIRTMLVSGGSIQVDKLHKKAIKFVQAKAQAEIIEQLQHILTEDERDVVRRGRNTKSNTAPKNADINDYRYATGFEALVGYLYLTGDLKRLMEIFELVSKMDR